jgi:hypothetical protein
MNSTIFVPKKIRVGCQKRSDTYTGQLAYVIYYDHKNVLRKQASWESWRNKDIEPLDFENAPTEGFVLNKKVGGDSSNGWDHRQTYVRVYDPRNFEFEITVPNLLYILENTSSIKGKGLEGQFVYGWDKTDLVLIPVSSPDYAKIAGFTDMITAPEKITSKDLVLGATYLTNMNKKWVYLGRFMEYDASSWNQTAYGMENGLKYFFYNEERAGLSLAYERIKSLSGRIVRTVNKEPVENYAEIMEELEHRDFFSPFDPDATEYVLLSQEEIEKHFQEKSAWKSVCLHLENGWNDSSIRYMGNRYWIDYSYSYNNFYLKKAHDETFNACYTDIGELLAKYPCYRKNIYLKNGKLKH